MLRERPAVNQDDSILRRRWFIDDYFELIVWTDLFGNVTEFQLCYDRGMHERALSWSAAQRYRHRTVLDSDRLGGRISASPVLVPDGVCDKEQLLRRFESASASIEPQLASQILGHIRAASV